MLNIKDIQFAYGSVQVLHDVSLEVPKGSVVHLIPRQVQIPLVDPKPRRME